MSCWMLLPPAGQTEDGNYMAGKPSAFHIMYEWTKESDKVTTFVTEITGRVVSDNGNVIIQGEISSPESTKVETPMRMIVRSDGKRDRSSERDHSPDMKRLKTESHLGA